MSNEILNKDVNEIEVVDALPVQCRVDRACEPEELFEMIEQCKICGRCV